MVSGSPNAVTPNAWFELIGVMFGVLQLTKYKVSPKGRQRGETNGQSDVQMIGI
jgi:hypothetical protein